MNQIDNTQIITLKTKWSDFFKSIEECTEEYPTMQIIKKVDDIRIVRKLRSFFPRRGRNTLSLYLRISTILTLNQLAMEVAVFLEICSYKQLKNTSLGEDSAWILIIGHFIFKEEGRLIIYIDYAENLTNKEWNFLSKLYSISCNLDAKISLILFVNE